MVVRFENYFRFSHESRVIDLNARDDALTLAPHVVFKEEIFFTLSLENEGIRVEVPRRSTDKIECTQSESVVARASVPNTD